MEKIPFEYGTIAENEYFIDRIDDRRDLKRFLGGGINVMLVSPRRWGKSSLVKAAMEELKSEQSDVRVCYLDAFKVFSEEDFYNKFASAVLQGVSSTLEKRMADLRQFLQSISPSITLSSDPLNAMEVKLGFQPLQQSAEEILNLPERMAREKGLRVIVCIDEFQQLAKLPGWKRLEGTMRSVWQGQHHTTYCLYGSKRHMMMDIFANSNNPFYRFGQLLMLKKIDRKYWTPFIRDSFLNHGKKISDEMIGRICQLMQCHSWYMQQFCFLLWTRTTSEVTEEIFSSQLAKLLETNEEMFRMDIDNLAFSQVALLCAVADGETHFNAQAIVQRYGLGSPRTITKNKQLLTERDLIERSGEGYRFVDPVFELWFKREYGK